MENKIDQHIQNTLADRSIEPSASSWERLSSKLDQLAVERRRKRRQWLYIASAASVLLMISLLIFKNDDTQAEKFVNPNQELVDKQPVEKINTNSKKEINVINETIIPKEAIAQVEHKKEVKTKPRKQKKATEGKQIIEFPKKDLIAITTVIKEQKNKVAPKKETEFTSTSRISVDSDALLYSVTHSKEEIKEYYTKYRVSRSKALKTIAKELKRQDITIDASTILAEVEMDLNEESFKNNFYQLIKKRVSDVATAIANRNN